MNTEPATTPMQERKAIWVFTPSRTDPKDLEFILVQRQALIQDAVERVRESALTEHKHHLLFVGPRGCGKTHLLTLVVSRLSADTELADRLRIAWLNEDETCTSLLEFLVKIHTALALRHPAEFREATLAPAYDLKPAAALEFVSQHLLSELGSHTLLVATENLDALFENLGETGQKQLRAFIQENPRLSLVATAQRLVEDLSDRTSPFFGFFQTEHLKPLNVEQATELLANIARLQAKADVVEFLATSRGRSRVRAIHHLSGGNHRIYIVLSQFVTRDSVDALLEPFMKMVDELTPYYQERIRWLPPLQRKIVELLCVSENTVPVKEIARRLFTSQQTISSQLLSLREKGYVESNQRGRESLYEVSEPLMRLCVEVKDNQRRQPLRLLVDFLRVWYDDQELKARLGKLEPASAACGYLEAAIQRNSTEGNLRKRILIKSLYSSLSEYPKSKTCDDMIQELKDAPEMVILAAQAWSEGKKDEAIRCLDEAIAAETIPAATAFIWMIRAAFHSAMGERNSEICDYTAVIELPSAPAEQVADALIGRGIRQDEAGELQRAIEDYTAVIGLHGVSVEQMAKAYLHRGISHANSNQRERGIADFSIVIDLPEAPSKQLVCALLLRGACNNGLGNAERAIADFTTLIDRPDAPVAIRAKAFVFRARCYFRDHRVQEARADWESVIRLPDAPHESVVDAHLALTELHCGEGRWSDGFASLGASLSHGEKVQPAYRGRTLDLVGIFFSAGLSPEGRRDKIAELLRAYANHQALAVLGEGLVQHIGGVFRSGKPFPSTDNLDGWASAWAQAAENQPDFQLSLRLLRTGVDFVKTGGEDPGILLTLTAPERTILEQALGLTEIRASPPRLNR